MLKRVIVQPPGSPKLTKQCNDRKSFVTMTSLRLPLTPLHPYQSFNGGNQSHLHCMGTLYFTMPSILQVPKSSRGKKQGAAVNKDRFISKMFLRGDSVILVLRNPK